MVIQTAQSLISYRKAIPYQSQWIGVGRILPQTGNQRSARRFGCVRTYTWLTLVITTRSNRPVACAWTDYIASDRRHYTWWWTRCKPVSCLAPAAVVTILWWTDYSDIFFFLSLPIMGYVIPTVFFLWLSPSIPALIFGALPLFLQSTTCLFLVSAFLRNPVML